MKTWILPMAGKGTRTLELGQCKPAIFVSGKPVLAWCLISLQNLVEPGDKIIGITTSNFEENYKISDILKRWALKVGVVGEPEMVLVDSTPPGPAASVYAAKPFVDTDSIAVVVNTDQFCIFSMPDHRLPWDAFLPLYVNSTGSSSYVDINNGVIKKIKEKELISVCASSGVYGFRRAEDLFSLLESELGGEPHFGNEFFVGPTINRMIERGGLVIPTSTIAKFDLGNVKSINQFSVMSSWFARTDIS